MSILTCQFYSYFWGINSQNLSILGFVLLSCLQCTCTQQQLTTLCATHPLSTCRQGLQSGKVSASRHFSFSPFFCPWIDRCTCTPHWYPVGAWSTCWPWVVWVLGKLSTQEGCPVSFSFFLSFFIYFHFSCGSTEHSKQICGMYVWLNWPTTWPPWAERPLAAWWLGKHLRLFSFSFFIYFFTFDMPHVHIHPQPWAGVGRRTGYSGTGIHFLFFLAATLKTMHIDAHPPAHIWFDPMRWPR